MGRRAVNNLRWWEHRTLRNERPFRLVRAQFGPAGYGLAVMVHEVVAEAELLQVPDTPDGLAQLALDCAVALDVLRPVLDCMSRCRLVVSSGGWLRCPLIDELSERAFDRRGRHLGDLRAGDGGGDTAEYESSDAATTTGTFLHAQGSGNAEPEMQVSAPETRGTDDLPF